VRSQEKIGARRGLNNGVPLLENYVYDTLDSTFQEDRNLQNPFEAPALEEDIARRIKKWQLHDQSGIAQTRGKALSRSTEQGVVPSDESRTGMSKKNQNRST